MTDLPVLDPCPCTIRGLIDLVGKKWTLCLVVTIGNHPGIRFNQIQSYLGSISPRTLSDTLKALQEEGLVARESFNEIPPRVEYRLTDTGLELWAAVRPLMEFAAARPGATCTP